MKQAAKEPYLILKYSKGTNIKYSCFLLNGSAIERGLFDWSGGREILTDLRHSRPGSMDIYVVQLTWKEVEAINLGKAKPPHPKWF